MAAARNDLIVIAHVLDRTLDASPVVAIVDWPDGFSAPVATPLILNHDVMFLLLNIWEIRIFLS